MHEPQPSPCVRRVAAEFQHVSPNFRTKLHLIYFERADAVAVHGGQSYRNPTFPDFALFDLP
ncbi:MAG TPA: hypothetical protein VEQ63_06720 [Bryobacteraceae bacterium]|nr:hypothetical protein [Bryobacteraceae bacterium]